MPFKMIDYQRKFKFVTTGDAPGGLPIADCILLGSARYVTVCPLCGMTHEVRRGQAIGDVFQPACIVKSTHPSVYAEWITKYPAALNYRHVTLKPRALITPLYDDAGTVEESETRAA